MRIQIVYMVIFTFGYTSAWSNIFQRIEERHNAFIENVNRMLMQPLYTMDQWVIYIEPPNNAIFTNCPCDGRVNGVNNNARNPVLPPQSWPPSPAKTPNRSQGRSERPSIDASSDGVDPIYFRSSFGDTIPNQSNSFAAPVPTRTPNISEGRSETSPYNPSIHGGNDLPNGFVSSTEKRMPTQPTMHDSSAPGVRRSFQTPSVDEKTIGNHPHLNSNMPNALSTSYELFNKKLYQVISNPKENSHQNVIYSPLSLQTLLAFVYTASSGKTEQELQGALEIPANKTIVLNMFRDLLQSQQNGNNETKLIMANKMYYDRNVVLNQQFYDYIRDSFDMEVQPLNFQEPRLAAQHINNWVAMKTQNRIQNVISPNVLDSQTGAVLVNAIYFKAKWRTEFSTSDTRKQSFYNFGTVEKPVDMMHNSEEFRYGEFSTLSAKIIELPYADSNLSMLIILPNEKFGLAQLEQRLQDEDLKNLADQLETAQVSLALPKFRIGFNLGMAGPLKQLGVQELFTPNAQLNGLFADQPMRVSKVQHKAYIEVNEAGSEAAAASFINLVPLSLPGKEVNFIVDHPFIFVIRSPNEIYFAGRVVQL